MEILKKILNKFGGKIYNPAEQITVHTALPGSVLDEVPYVDSYSYSGGDRYNEVAAYVISRDGDWVELAQNYRHEYGAEHEPTEAWWGALPIGAQIASLETDWEWLVIYRHSHCDWEDQDGLPETTIDVFPRTEIDVEKIRRRVRDALNKTADAGLIMKAAVLFGVKLG